ncbi:MAG: hypothetical protein RBT63_09795 [Bdellovibrionales bacterium]|nr:hypothetical protein [Bdellovibrionales bacterium]
MKLSLVAVDDKGGYGTMIDASGSPRLRFVCMSEPFGQRCYWLDYLTEAGAGLGSVEGIGCSEDNARYCSVIHDWKVRSLLSMVRAASPQCPLDVIVKIDRASGLVRHVGTNLAACAVL